MCKARRVWTIRITVLYIEAETRVCDVKWKQTSVTTESVEKDTKELPIGKIGSVNRTVYEHFRNGKHIISPINLLNIYASAGCLFQETIQLKLYSSVVFSVVC